MGRGENRPNDFSVIEFQSEEVNKAHEYCKSHNTAVLAMLFTDVVGSTAFTESAGDAVSTKMRHIHDSLFVETIRRNGSVRSSSRLGIRFSQCLPSRQKPFPALWSSKKLSPSMAGSSRMTTTR